MLTNYLLCDMDANFGKFKILLIEDDEDLRFIMRGLLIENGINPRNIDDCADPKKAKAYLSLKTYNLVITDNNLYNDIKRNNGLEIIESMREEFDRNQFTPVCLLTGDGGDSDFLERAEKAKAQVFLKPLSNLIERVREMLLSQPQIANR